MTVKLETHWTCMAYLEGLLGEGLFSLCVEWQYRQYLNKQQGFRNNILWTGETILYKHLILTVSDGGVMICACFDTWSGHLAVTELSVNCSVYQRILEDNDTWCQKKKRVKCCNDPVKVQTSTQMKYSGVWILKEFLQTSILKQHGNEEWATIPAQSCESLIEVTPAWGGSSSY